MLLLTTQTGGRTLNYSAQRSSFLLSFASFLVIFFSTPAFCANGVIATLTDFSGTVLIRSRGNWAVEPRENLPLYSQDAVVTRMGNATITFDDGAIIQVKSNSNLLIQEREKEEDFFRRARVIERRVLLFLGKLFFRTGRARLDTRFETATAVVGIRGTEGWLSIDVNGQPYINFLKGGPAYTNGVFEEGVPKDVRAELADKNPIQIAAFVAKAAADQAERAAGRAAAGEISEAQLALFRARAAKAAAQYDLNWATLWIENNPADESVDDAENVRRNSQGRYESATEDEAEAKERGGETIDDVEAYEPPEKTGFDVEVQEEPSIQDTEPGSSI